MECKENNLDGNQENPQFYTIHVSSDLKPMIKQDPSRDRPILFPFNFIWRNSDHRQLALPVINTINVIVVLFSRGCMGIYMNVIRI